MLCHYLYVDYEVLENVCRYTLMDHFSMNPHLEISKDTMGPSMMDGDTKFVYGAWGPYTNSIDSIVEFLKSHNIGEGYKSICDDGEEGRWIIIQSTNTAYIAQGPFQFDVDEMVTNEDNCTIGVRRGQEKRFIELRGLGKPCFDYWVAGEFWVISKLHDVDEGQSFCAPPTIPSTCNIAAMEANIHPTLGFHTLEVKGHVFQDLVEEDAATMLLEVGRLGEGGQQMVEETIFSTPNLGDANNPTRKRPWMDEPPCFTMVEGTVATTNTSSKGCKPRRKQARQSQFKQHGVKRYVFGILDL